MIENFHRPRGAHQLTELVQELVDAHSDTICIAGAGPSAAEWGAHLAYLRDLQRVGKRLLAELAG